LERILGNKNCKNSDKEIGTENIVLQKEEMITTKPELMEDLKVEEIEDHKVSKEEDTSVNIKLISKNDEWLQEEDGEIIEESLPPAVRVVNLDF